MASVLATVTDRQVFVPSPGEGTGVMGGIYYTERTGQRLVSIHSLTSRSDTVDAAFVLRKDDVLGSIEPGKFADFAILDDDPFEVDPRRLRDIPIRGTILGGEVNLASEI